MTFLLPAEVAEMRNAGEKRLRWSLNAKHGYENQHSRRVRRSLPTRVSCWSGLLPKKPKSHHWRTFEPAVLIRLIIEGYFLSFLQVT